MELFGRVVTIDVGLSLAIRFRRGGSRAWSIGPLMVSRSAHRPSRGPGETVHCGLVIGETKDVNGSRVGHTDHDRPGACNAALRQIRFVG